MDETFLLTNIAPQVGVDFNRHYWAYVEDWCRRLTSTFQDVYVFTVPLYLPKRDSDGKWRVVSQSSILLAGEKKVERLMYNLIDL